MKKSLKEEKQAQIEIDQAAGDAFIAAYKVLCDAHSLMIVAEMVYGPGGIGNKLTVVKQFKNEEGK